MYIVHIHVPYMYTQYTHVQVIYAEITIVRVCVCALLKLKNYKAYHWVMF